MLSQPPPLRLPPVGLADLAGFVDAIAFVQLGGFFVSFMSGNSTRLGVGLAGDSAATTTALCLLAAFVIGVTAGSLIARRAGRSQRAAVLAAVAIGLAAAAIAQKGEARPIAALLMAASMGAENAVFERDGETRSGVTFMTGALVKVGQGLASALTGGGRWRWLAPLGLWSGLIAGAWAGTQTYLRFEASALWGATRWS